MYEVSACLTQLVHGRQRTRSPNCHIQQDEMTMVHCLRPGFCPYFALIYRVVVYAVDSKLEPLR
jgi:hypothetical protein